MRLPARTFAVAAGGALGSWARWGISAGFRVLPGTFPVTTFAINVVGAAGLGIVVVLLLDRPAPRTHLHAFLGTGALGAFTTFSTFVVEAVELVRLGSIGVAAAYVVLSVAAGTAAVLATMALTRRVLGAVRAVPLA